MFCCEIIELILAFIFLGVCITTFIWRLIKGDRETLFIEFEIWSLLLQLVYYLLFSLISFVSVFRRSEDHTCQKFIKNTIFKLLFPFVVNSSASFSLGYFFRWFEFGTIIRDNDFWLNIFIHGISPAVFVLDLLIFRRKYIDTPVFDFLVITGIYVGYCALLFMYKPNIQRYIFLDQNNLTPKDNVFIISLMVVFYFVYLYLYFILTSIVRFKSGVSSFFGVDKKNKKRSKTIEVTDEPEKRKESGNKLVPMEDEEDNEKDKGDNLKINDENDDDDEEK